MKFPLEVFEAVRAVWPKHKALGVRFSATDWVDSSSWDVPEATAFSHELKKRGADFIDVSSGGNSPLQKIDVGLDIRPALPVISARDRPADNGCRTNHRTKTGRSDLRSGQADMVALARGMLYNPRWAWHAAEALDAEAAYAPQYMRTNRALRGLPIPGNPPTPK